MACETERGPTRLPVGWLKDAVVTLWLAKMIGWGTVTEACTASVPAKYCTCP
jgi:hypothetical protein